MAEQRDYYDALGVSRDADDKLIKAAWRRGTMKYHPDRNPGTGDAERKLQEINAAYEVLSDPEKRDQYDRFGHAAAQAGAPPRGASGSYGIDLGDLFGGVFGDAFNAPRRRGPRPGADMSQEAVISLEQAARGGEMPLDIMRRAACETCDGSGAAPGSSVSTCKACNGHGVRRRVQGIFSTQEACPSCRGQGQTIDQPCSDCAGRGAVNKTEHLKITVPVGVDDGDSLRMRGKGDCGQPGAPPGDMYIQFTVLPHPLCTRDGDDLYTELSISFATAALGGSPELPTLDGPVKVKIAPGTASGKLIRLRGKGVQSLRRKHIGDLLCRVSVEVPVKLSRAQQQLLSKFDSSLKPGNAAPSEPSSWHES